MNLIPDLLTEFDEKFPNNYTDYDVYAATEPHRQAIKSFLLSSLQRLGREVVESLPEKTEEKDFGGGDCGAFLKYGNEKGWNSARETVLKVLRDNGVEL